MPVAYLLRVTCGHPLATTHSTSPAGGHPAITNSSRRRSSVRTSSVCEPADPSSICVVPIRGGPVKIDRRFAGPGRRFDSVRHGGYCSAKNRAGAGFGGVPFWSKLERPMVRGLSRRKGHCYERYPVTGVPTVLPKPGEAEGGTKRSEVLLLWRFSLDLMTRRG